MKILIIGSGGREHAICTAFLKSSKSHQLFCAPGNAGISAIAECVPIKHDEILKLTEFAVENDIELTFVGGEVPLALGIVDEFQTRGLRIVGVSKAAARLESSKAFAKDFMIRHNIPTAAFRNAHSARESIDILNSGAFGAVDVPVVIKADGLAAGKGVVVAKNRTEAIAAINDMAGLVGAEAAKTIVLEECLFGREVSLILFADGENFVLMPPTRDHKRIGEGDVGPNTGGMGTISSGELLSAEQLDFVVERMIKPTLSGCSAEGVPFRGIMFLGIMMDCGENNQYESERPTLLEYNVRFGDPETQSILVRLESDFVDICESIIDGTLDMQHISWRKGHSATIVLAADGYPGKARGGDVIHGLEAAKTLADISLFHAGTAFNTDGEFVTSGGRVLGVTATAENLDEALRKAYAAVEKISWEGMQYRRDIGK